MKTNEENYIKINIDYNYELSEGDLKVIDEFNDIFPKVDAYIEVQNGKMIINLNRINFKLLEQFCEENTNRESELHHEIYKSINDIRSYNIKGQKRIYANYNAERKVKKRKKKEQKRDKMFYTKGNNFSTENNELPSEFENQIICGDSLEVLKKLPDNCIDLVFTSPPYNFGLEYENQDDDHYWEHYFDKLFSIFDEGIRVLKFGGRFIVNIQPLFSDYIPSHHIISKYFIDRKMSWKGEILWEKNNYNCKYTAWGSWKSPSSPYLKYTWEFLEVFCKGTIKKKGDRDKIDITADEFKKWVVAKWSIAPERRMKEFDHPAMFPEELAKRVMKLFSYKEDVILDPFNGVGTTTVVANRLNRRYIGIDISKNYCKKAKERINED